MMLVTWSPSRHVTSKASSDWQIAREQQLDGCLMNVWWIDRLLPAIRHQFPRYHIVVTATSRSDKVNQGYSSGLNHCSEIRTILPTPSPILDVFLRFCYAVWSAIGTIMSSVCNTALWVNDTSYSKCLNKWIGSPPGNTILQLEPPYTESYLLKFPTSWTIDVGAIWRIN